MMTLTAKTQLAWQLTLLLYTGLLLILAIDHTVMRLHFYWPVWLMQTLPLLLVLPGLLQHRARSGTWICFIILFHLLASIDNAATSGHFIFYGAMATLTLSLFTTSLLFVRWQRLQDSL